MATIIIFHEVDDGDLWDRAWKKGPGSRHEMFAQYGLKARTFHDPENPNSRGLMVEVHDIKSMLEIMNSEEGKKAMTEDGLKVETIRMLTEFTP